MEKYNGEFHSRRDVAAEFEEGKGRSWDVDFAVAEGFPSDDEIIYATYDVGSYDGSAFVLFERDGKLYEVNASHCSCFGLEGQWEPEETSWAALAIRKPSSYGTPDDVIELAKTNSPVSPS